MLVVVFEVETYPDKKKDYLNIAADLASILQEFDGFISIERFESLSQPGKILSLSFWRDEESIRKWRNIEKHREAQRAGRGGIFSEYRLRVANVVRDYGMRERTEAPQDSKTTHDKK